MRWLALLPILLLGAGSSSAATGTTITVTNASWQCTRPLSSYGPLPITVELNYTVNFPGQGARLGAGCVGDGTPATDLILHVNGDGLTYGTQDDAVRIMNSRPGASNIEIEGYAQCGSQKGTGFHQDGVQVLGGTNLTFRNFEVGHWDEQVQTCQGAGGAFFYSEPSVNVDVLDSKFMGCNHSLLAGVPSTGAEVTNSQFRSGYPAGDPVCDGYYVSDPCVILPEWDGTTSNIDCDRFPWGDGSPPPPPPSPFPPAPPAPPCGELGVPSIC
jgi:hypothetical protein